MRLCGLLFRQACHALDDRQGGGLARDVDVIYHLVEDQVFDYYMRDLFQSAKRYVIVYASDEDKVWPARHVRHRRFTDWIKDRMLDWNLVERVPNRYPYDPGDDANTSFSDFFVFEKARS